MRAAIISDVDGSSEYNTVQLTPSNWAWLAKQKAESGPKGETVESLTWKISRLEKINLILNGMIAVRSTSSLPYSIIDLILMPMYQNPSLVNGSTSPGPAPGPAPPDPATGPVAEFLKTLQAYQNASVA